MTSKPKRVVGTAKGTLKVGYVAALCLKTDSAPSRCYVGQVEEIDEHGVRLTLMDWLIGQFVSWDFFAPWDSITSALVATPTHDLKSFGDAAGEFQTRCNNMAEGKEAMEEALREYRQPLD